MYVTDLLYITSAQFSYLLNPRVTNYVMIVYQTGLHSE